MSANLENVNHLVLIRKNGRGTIEIVKTGPRNETNKSPFGTVSIIK